MTESRSRSGGSRTTYTNQLPDAVESYVIAFDGGSGMSQQHQYVFLNAVAVDEADLRMAVAILANRQEQDIATGVVTVMEGRD